MAFSRQAAGYILLPSRVGKFYTPNTPNAPATRTSGLAKLIVDLASGEKVETKAEAARTGGSEAGHGRVL